MKILLVNCVFCIFALLHAAPVEEGNGIYGDHFEGDIVFSPEQEEALTRNGRTGITDLRKRWPKVNGLVRVPYVIDSQSGYTSAQLTTIRTGMSRIEAVTCIRFAPRTTQSDYIRIFSGSGCWSYVGRIGGRQDLSLLRNGCVYTGTVQHELIHALGFGHMHQHPDRDTKVRINWENIQDGNAVWFEKIYGTNNYGTPYDISSVMHYEPWGFSKNGKDVITAHNPADQSKIGGDVLTSGDIQRLRNLYQC